MKSTIICICLFSFLCSLQAQVVPYITGASFPQEPYSPMVTDPVKVIGTPYTPLWRNNLFKWYGSRPAQDPQAPENWRGYDPFAHYEIWLRRQQAPNANYQVNIPHCDEDQIYTNALRYGNVSRSKGKEPDYLSADGWELVKQNLGYLRYGNTTASQNNTFPYLPTPCFISSRTN